jgi:hypothetical protein
VLFFDRLQMEAKVAGAHKFLASGETVFGVLPEIIERVVNV